MREAENRQGEGKISKGLKRMTGEGARRTDFIAMIGMTTGKSRINYGS